MTNKNVREIRESSSLVNGLAIIALSTTFIVGTSVLYGNFICKKFGAGDDFQNTSTANYSPSSQITNLSSVVYNK